MRVQGPSAGVLVAAAVATASASCRCGGDAVEPDAGASAANATVGAGGAESAERGAEDDAEADGGATPAAAEPTCPSDMVRIAKRFCIDRFEASLVDSETGMALSPYYPPSRKMATFVEKTWQKERLEVGDEAARAMPLPELLAWQRQRDFEPRAVSRRGVVPSGYVSGTLAAVACKNAGKRLCTLEEWRTACRGERDRLHPYGDEFVPGKCNVFRESHPAFVLHGDASKGHLDPRLNLVRFSRGPGLRKTGETPACVSEWEGDGVWDMVGNLDEWIDDPEGTFVGAFYSRSKKDGCDSIVRSHPIDYFDYSTGVRCCLSPDDAVPAVPVSVPTAPAATP